MSHTTFTPYIPSGACAEEGVVYRAAKVRCERCNAFLRAENEARGTCDTCERKLVAIDLAGGSRW